MAEVPGTTRRLRSPWAGVTDVAGNYSLQRVLLNERIAMKLFAAVVLMLTNSLAFGQVPHVTQPFSYLWDYPTVNVTLTPGFTQVAHFEIQLDALTPVSTIPPVPISVPSGTAGFLSFKVLADPALSTGSHTFNVWACPTLIAASGCVGAVAFPFVLDPKALPSAQRLGVGL